MATYITQTPNELSSIRISETIFIVFRNHEITAHLNRLPGNGINTTRQARPKSKFVVARPEELSGIIAEGRELTNAEVCECLNIQQEHRQKELLDWAKTVCLAEAIYGLSGQLPDAMLLDLSGKWGGPEKGWLE